MEPPPSSRRQSYTEFFTSGLRAVTRRTKIPSQPVQGYDRSSFWSDSHFEGQSNNLFARQRRRRRHNSLIVGDKVPVTKSQPPEKRRSALMDIPARLFSRMSLMSATRSIPSIGHQESLRGRSSHMGQSTSGGLSSESLAPEGRPILLPIDPFSSWSDSDSFVTDSLSGASRLHSKVEENRESFLSLNSSSSSVILPRPERYTFLSISVSSQSSLSSLTCQSAYQQKIDVQWDEGDSEEEDSEAIIQRQAAIVESEGSEAWDAPAWIDWRQFHNDLLSDSDVNY